MNISEVKPPLREERFTPLALKTHLKNHKEKGGRFIIVIFDDRDKGTYGNSIIYLLFDLCTLAGIDHFWRVHTSSN